MITGSKELIRDMNTQLVLRSIMMDGPVSRASIAQKAILYVLSLSGLPLHVKEVSTFFSQNMVIWDIK